MRGDTECAPRPCSGRGASGSGREAHSGLGAMSPLGVRGEGREGRGARGEGLGARSPSAARGEGLWARSEGLGARSPLGARGEKTIFGFGAKSVGRGSRGQRRGARVQRRGARVEVRGPRGDGPGARGEGREGVHWEGVQGSEGMGGAFTRCAF